MGLDDRGTCQGLIYALGLALTAWIILHAGPSRSEALGESRHGQRWSNDRHIAETVEVTGCGTRVAPGYRAGYAAGVDASGRPVAPAGSGTEYRTTGLYASVGVATESEPEQRKVGKTRKGGREAEDEGSAGGVEASIELEPVEPRDCLPSPK